MIPIGSEEAETSASSWGQPDPSLQQGLSHSQRYAGIGEEWGWRRTHVIGEKILGLGFLVAIEDRERARKPNQRGKEGARNVHQSEGGARHERRSFLVYEVDIVALRLDFLEFLLELEVLLLATGN